MVTISDRSRAIAALEADRAELFIESAGYTQRMFDENHRHLRSLRHLSALQWGVAEKLAANEAAIDKLMGEV